jgi:predicted ABC-type ATPase
MQEKKLYIISGCNGAGKTTASFNILPVLLNCKEIVYTIPQNSTY